MIKIDAPGDHMAPFPSYQRQGAIVNCPFSTLQVQEKAGCRSFASLGEHDMAPKARNAERASSVFLKRNDAIK
ncbi:hypothetical protein [Capsulimonas corticalis]|uniref:hypothetical protein n=1 Tax=Capsulimonas corticalis TaxID=2219043 RepID=UPI000E6498B5|nr:hypothetical protein [Capsulimonas corticalis]